MKDLEKIIRQTNDGSFTIYIPQIDENYHSVHGAIQESNHVFIKEGLNQIPSKNISVFEVGFGTGLNAFLSYFYGDVNQVCIDYVSIEAYPLSFSLVEDYMKKIDVDANKDILLKLHLSEWGKIVELSDYFKLKKIKDSIDLVEIKGNSFDIIFYDAFGPRVQPEMWTLELFLKMHGILKKGGFLVTYCAKGQVKRDLKTVGFEVETCQGPPGKREMIRAWKK